MSSVAISKITHFFLTKHMAQYCDTKATCKSSEEDWILAQNNFKTKETVQEVCSPGNLLKSFCTHTQPKNIPKKVTQNIQVLLYCCIFSAFNWYQFHLKITPQSSAAVP